MKKTNQYLVFIVATLAFITTSAAGAQKQNNKCLHQVEKYHQDPELAKIKSTVADAVNKLRETDKVPGITYAVFDADSVLFTGTSGVANVDTQRELSASETLYRVASNSKLFATISLSQLIERGVLSSDTSIMDLDKVGFVRFLKAHETHERLARWAKIKVRDLMSHQAGISKDIPGQIVGFFNTSALEDHAYPLMNGLYPGLLKVEFLYEPGQVASGIKYSNLGMNLIARIVEDLNPEQLSFQNYVKRHILRPLNMRHTYYDLSGANRNKLVTGYSSTKKPIPAVYEVGSYDGSIGVATTAKDMAALGIEMLKMFSGESTILKDQNTIKQLFELKSFVTPGLSWAHGPLWQALPNETAADPLWVGHTGTGPDARTIILVSPERGLGVVVLLNTMDANREPYVKLIADTMKWQPANGIQLSSLGKGMVDSARTFLTTKTPIAPPTVQPSGMDVALLQKYVGDYYADIVDIKKITLSEDGYLMFFGQKLIVENLAKGEFRFPVIPGPAGILFNAEPIRFKFDSSGRVTGMVVANAKYFVHKN